VTTQTPVYAYARAIIFCFRAALDFLHYSNRTCRLTSMNVFSFFCNKRRAVSAHSVWNFIRVCAREMCCAHVFAAYAVRATWERQTIRCVHRNISFVYKAQRYGKNYVQGGFSETYGQNERSIDSI